MKIKYEPIFLVLVCLCLLLTFYQSYQTYQEDYAKKNPKRVDKKKEDEKKEEEPPKQKRAVRKSPKK